MTQVKKIKVVIGVITRMNLGFLTTGLANEKLK